MRARSCALTRPFEGAVLASALRRDPKRGRAWYRPSRRAPVGMVAPAQLAERAYGEGGPKHGLRRRRDAIETLVCGYRYLHVRAAREQSSDYACTAEDTILGLAHELSRRSAKAWDPGLGRGLAPGERRELLLRHRGRALAKLLDELAGCGLLVWGGERDNNGLWWRLRIRLLDPDGPSVEAEPWMRPSGRLTDAQAGNGDAGGGEGTDAPCGAQEPYERPPALGALYDRIVALGRDRPALSPGLEGRIVAATERFAAHASQRPAGVGNDPWAALAAQVEQFTTERDGEPLARALPLFDALTRRMQARSRNDHQGIRDVPDSRNCAAPFQDQPNGLKPNHDDPQALASRTGAHPPGESDGRTAVRNAIEGPAEIGNDRLGGGRGGAARDPFAGVAERVAVRERRLVALVGPRRAREAETVARARSWGSERPVPIGLLTAAAEALVRQRPWLDDAQLERLRRAERRYTRYAAHRPTGAPAGPAGVLVALLEHPPPAVRAPLQWAIAQLDLLTKRMRRAAKRPTTADRTGAAEHLAAPRRRAGRRRARQARQATTWYRRGGDKRRGELAHAIERLAAQVSAGHIVGGILPGFEVAIARVRGRRVDDTRRRSLTWHIANLAHQLTDHGNAITAEQVRRELRDELLLTGARARCLVDVDGPATGLGTPDHFDPSRAQLHSADPDRLAVRHGLLRQRAPDSERGMAAPSAPPGSGSLLEAVRPAARLDLDESGAPARAGTP